jgi:D-aminopeptidase
MPEAARKLIKQKTLAGLKRRDEIPPFTMAGPLTLDLYYTNPSAAEMIAYLPNVERSDSHTARFVGDIVEISMFIEMALAYPPTMNHWPWHPGRLPMPFEFVGKLRV